MIELSFNKIQKYYGAELVLNDISFEVKSGERIGLIGKNGCGKTTIFKLIAGLEPYEEGEIIRRKSLSIGYMEQHIEKSDLNTRDYILSGFIELNEISKSMKEYEVKLLDYSNEAYDLILKTYGKLQVKYELAGGYKVEEMFKRVCNGIKIDSELLNKSVNELSGGQKVKVTLAKSLVTQPDLLLLDEPTNHLDLDSVTWLEKFFGEYPGTIVIVSHDRYFLDNVVNKIVEIENMEAKEYIGNYSSYVEEKKRWIESQIAIYNNQQKKIKTMEEAIVRFRVWGNNGSDKAYVRAKDMLKKIERMDKIDKPKLDKKKVALNFENEGKIGKRILKVNSIKKSFNSKPILNDINFELYNGQKAIIVGENGSGKSTLLNIITNNIITDEGDISLHNKAKPMYINQEVDFGDARNDTLLHYISRSLEIGEGSARSILAKFLFFGDDVFKQITSLSGGEKLKLKLCELTHNNSNFLILDEPTNHLDIVSREILESSLLDYEGTILMVSHDRYFINKIANQVYELDNGKLKFYNGDYEYYLEKRNLSKNKHIKISEKNKTNSNKVKTNKKKINNFKLTELENQISDLEDGIHSIDNEMIANSTNAGLLTELYQKKDKLEFKLAGLYENLENILN